MFKLGLCIFRRILGKLRWSAGSFTLGDFRSTAPRRASVADVSPVSRVSSCDRVVCDAYSTIRPVGLPAIAHPPRRVLARRAGCVSRVPSGARVRISFVGPAILHPPLAARLSAPKDMSVAIGARSWTRDRVVRYDPVRRRAM